jgi:hypothetical protein
MFDNLSLPEPDPVIEHYKQFVDLDEIKENLRLTHEERLQKLIRRLREAQSESVVDSPAGG